VASAWQARSPARAEDPYAAPDCIVPRVHNRSGGTRYTAARGISAIGQNFPDILLTMRSLMRNSCTSMRTTSSSTNKQLAYALDECCLYSSCQLVLAGKSL